jgi:hypothetical protein
MRRTSKVFQQHIAYILLISLYLQGCGGFSNSFTPITEESIIAQQTNLHNSIIQIGIEPLVDQVLTAQGGHVITFYEEAGKLKADVKMNVPQRFSKTYEGLSVAIEQGAGLANLSRLDTKAQRRRIYLQPAEEGNPAKIIIYQGAGLLGGMLEGEEEVEEDEQGKRKKARIEIAEEQKQNLIEQVQGTSSFDILPLEIWQEVFSYLKFENILPARAVNRNWNGLITGFPQAGIVGAENQPQHIIDTHGWLKTRAINLNYARLRQITPKTIPSFTFYRLIGHVKKLRKEFWPYLKGSNIHTIDLSQGQIGKQSAEGFAKYLQGTRVHTVDLSSNKIGDRGAEGFAKHLQGTRVHTVDLSYNRIGDQGAESAESFAKQLQQTQVHTVNLSYNQIGDQGAESFAKQLQQTQVHTVNLSQNQIGDQGAETFAKHLKGTRVHTVNLSQNQIGDQGAEMFAKHLKGTRVYTVDLRGNQIGDKGAERFAKHLQETRVHTVDLSYNQIGDQGAEEFARLLQGTQVHLVNLRVNSINTNAQQLLKEQHSHIRWIF